MTRRTKPPKGALCDLAIGWHNDACGAPVIERCKEQATTIIKTGKRGFEEVYVCDKHKNWTPEGLK